MAGGAIGLLTATDDAEWELREHLGLGGASAWESAAAEPSEPTTAWPFFVNSVGRRQQARGRAAWEEENDVGDSTTTTTAAAAAATATTLPASADPFAGVDCDDDDADENENAATTAQSRKRKHVPAARADGRRGEKGRRRKAHVSGRVKGWRSFYTSLLCAGEEGAPSRPNSLPTVPSRFASVAEYYGLWADFAVAEVSE